MSPRLPPSQAERLYQRWSRSPEMRPSAAKRGYGRRWRRLREMQLNREPLCRVCLEMGFETPATDVDHIVPIRDGGRNSLENLQSLCHLHHSQKTGREHG